MNVLILQSLIVESKPLETIWKNKFFLSFLNKQIVQFVLQNKFLLGIKNIFTNVITYYSVYFIGIIINWLIQFRYYI